LKYEKFYFLDLMQYFCPLSVLEVKRRFSMDEQEVAEGCSRSESGAQRALFETYAPCILALITRYVGQEDAAKDVLQETFIRVFNSFGQFQWRGKGSLKAWIERVAVNMSLNYLRDSRRVFTTMQPVETIEDTVDEPTDEEVESIDQDTILKFVSELPAGYRTVFNLFCIEGYSHRQIAEQLGINEKSSSSQLARAKALLARRIKTFLKEAEE
jgi:RNA polymerase sigma-70 factor (ECF subfamily)